MTIPPLQHVLKKKLHTLQRMVAAPEKLAHHEERLHELRVRLKEWRAALRLLQGTTPDFPAMEISERFRAVFHSAGGVRFWQLQRSFLNRSGAQLQPFAGRYRAHIRARLRQTRSAFQASAKAGWPKWRELKPAVRRASAACTPQSLEAYFDALQVGMSAKKAVLDRRHASELHELRKLLREYSDNRKLVIKHLHFDPGVPRGLSTDITAVAKLLGDWHDQDAACRQLAEYLRSPACAGEVLMQGKAVLRAWRSAEREYWNRVMTQFAST
jgi:CHAD domain-containing protein